VVLAGCGRLGFDPSAGTDAPAIDAAVDVPVIDAIPLGPFGAAVRLVELDTGQVEDDFSLSPDLLEIIFTRAPGTTAPGELYRATRVSVGAPFGTPTPVTELNTTGHEASPHVTNDGLTIIYTSERAGGQGSYDLWQATRPTTVSPWQNLTPLVELNSPLADTQSKLDPSGTRIAFATANTSISFASGELWEATRSMPSGAWGPPAKIAELNTSDGDLGPCYADGGLTLYFYSDRPGSAGADIYRASRPSLTAPFGAAEPVAELNTSGRDEDPWLSPDGRTILFTRDDAIYQATR